MNTLILISLLGFLSFSMGKLEYARFTLDSSEDTLDAMEMAQFSLATLNSYQLDKKLYYLVNIVFCHRLKNKANIHVERIVVAPVESCSFTPSDKNVTKCNLEDAQHLKVIDFYVLTKQTSNGRTFNLVDLKPLILSSTLEFHPKNPLFADNNKTE